MELMFKSIKDAIRFRLYLSANGLQDSFIEKRSRFIYSFNQIFVHRERYLTAIIQFIQDAKKNEWLNNALQEMYKYESEVERNEIIEIVRSMCNGSRPELISLASEMNEEEMIAEAVEDLLDFNGTIAFESFQKFRLRTYYGRLHDYLKIAIDEYKMEQEYQMFIYMLRDYLQQRGTRVNIVHVLLKKPIVIYDEFLIEMSNEKIAELLDKRLLSNHPVYVDSSVIAPLLSMAPKKIFIYVENEDEPLVRTLANIFEERISIFSPNYFYTLAQAYSDKNG